MKERPKAYQVLFKHKGSKNFLSLEEESLGTQIVFAFIPFIADTLKNKKVLVSDLYPLSDFSVRKQENVEKGYMLGKYGAVPFIKNDYNLWEKE